MYRNNVITGNLCAPLCLRGDICDVTSTYGNAHKEVMVAQCRGFCKHGYSVKAVLKHDEVTAAPEGYDQFYSTLNDTAVDNDADWKESLRRLLRHHLPGNSSVVDRLLREMLGGKPAASNGNFSFFAFYNSLTQLFQQKEYVLFQAYRNTGVFPKVYGTCGPLYLVEFCDPILNQDEQHDRAFALNSLLGWDKESKDGPEKGNVQTVRNSVVLLENHKNTDNHIHQTGNTLFDEMGDRLFEDKSKHVYIQHGPKFGRHHSWPVLAHAAIKILRLLEYLEQEDTFSGHIHLCDPKLEHFAIGTDDRRLKLIDADLVLFDFNMAAEPETSVVDTGVCTEHKDCSDVMCRGWCWKGAGRCASRRVNNNLQGICENVFLRPSLEYGFVFTAFPVAVYDDVSRSLCECATNVTGVWQGVPLKMPPASTGRKLVDVLENSLSVENSHDLLHIGGGNDLFFLFEHCKSFDQSLMND
ncbi:divergent protein kinase domain 1C-like isoform X2 [Babylonia areolata]